VAALTSGYVMVFVPRLQAAAAVRAAANRPRRRPHGPAAAVEDPAAGSGTAPAVDA